MKTRTSTPNRAPIRLTIGGESTIVGYSCIEERSDGHHIVAKIYPKYAENDAVKSDVQAMLDGVAKTITESFLGVGSNA